MKNISEGNLYNIEMDIKRTPNPSQASLDSWKQEIRKQLMQILMRQNTPNMENIIKSVFGETLE